MAWVAIEPKHKEILSFQFERMKQVCSRTNSISDCKHVGKHQVSSDGGTWHPKACKFLNLKHRIHSSFEKSLIERTMQYEKDRIESFDDYFPCRKNKCNLHHIKQWLKLFVYQHNKEIIS